MKRLRLGLLLLPLAVLGGCSAKPLVRTETAIPESGSNGDLLEVAKMLRLDLAECNRSKARLREWIERENAAMGKTE